MHTHSSVLFYTLHSIFVRISIERLRGKHSNSTSSVLPPNGTNVFAASKPFYRVIVDIFGAIAFCDTEKLTPFESQTILQPKCYAVFECYRFEPKETQDKSNYPVLSLNPSIMCTSVDERISEARKEAANQLSQRRHVLDAASLEAQLTDSNIRIIGLVSRLAYLQRLQ